ncbi:MAG TPA: aminotransferase class I/II-fold pyridoxal phosphate-dependent enzyme, partial [Phycisphaerales bacterium]|nr:aminotransferase class I/II-fold pyridoxal phosphate-dependent enzyme [Phycisphaerales bacterium]
LSDAIRAGHQFLTYAVPTPLQYGAAAALKLGDHYYRTLHDDYLHRRNLLCDALETVGFGVCRPAGTYFVMCDHTSFGFDGAQTFCQHLVEEVGVVAIPPGSFYVDPKDGHNLVRFAFCKTTSVLNEAISRLARLGA